MPAMQAALPDVSRFFETSWSVFRRRVWPLLTIAGLGSVVSLAASLVPVGAAAAAAAAGASPWAAFGLGGAASLSILLWLMSWVQVAMIECALAPDGSAGAWDCSKRAWPKVAAFSWVCILYLLVVMGGCFLFVLPGLFLAMALIFAPFICVAEGIGGWAALKRSLDETKGLFWAVAGRAALAGLASSLPGMVPLIGWLLSAAAGPFTLTAMVVAYRDVRAARGGAPEDSGRGWLLVASLAALLIPTAVGARVVPELVARAPQLLEAGRKMLQEPQDPQQLQKLLSVLDGTASTGESVTTAVSLAEQFSAPASTAAAPSGSETPPK